MITACTSNQWLRALARRVVFPLVALLPAAALILAARADEPQPAARSDEVQAMQGTWTIESFLYQGNPIEESELKTWRRIVADNHVTWKRKDEVLVELSIKFDPTARPKTLDSTVATGDGKGQLLKAIYELKGDELRVCFAEDGKPRPKGFSSTAGSGESLYTARRVKPE